MKENEIFCFCHVPKAGGSFVGSILRGAFGTRHLDAMPRWRNGNQILERRDLEFDLKLYPSVRSISGHALAPHKNYGRIQSRFRWGTVLRNPHTRYVSHYIHHVEKKGYRGSFEEWADLHDCGDHQCATISGKKDAGATIEILNRFHVVCVLEDRKSMYRVLSRAIGIDESDFQSHKKVNEQKGTLDKNRLMEDSRDLISERNQQDQIVYDYVVENLLPEMKKMYENDSYDTVLNISSTKKALCRLKRNAIYKTAVKMRECFLKITRNNSSVDELPATDNRCEDNDS